MGTQLISGGNEADWSCHLALSYSTQHYMPEKTVFDTADWRVL
jgi:hypothetical protein